MKSIVISICLLTICLLPSFSYGQSRYWVGGSGNWSQSSHWSSTSGGAGGATIPTFVDDVYINASSGSTGFLLTIDVDASCKNFISTGANNFTLAGAAIRNIQVHGSLTLHLGLTHSFSGSYIFLSAFPANQINTFSISLPSNLIFDGTGEWTFQSNTNTTKNLIQNNGTLFLNGKTISAYEYISQSNNTKTLNLFNSTLQIGKNFIGSAGLTLVSTGSLIKLLDIQAELRSANNLTFHNVEFTSGILNATHYGNINTSNNCTFNKIKYNNNGFLYGDHTVDSLQMAAGKILSIGHGNTIVIKKLLIDGTCTLFTTLKSTLNGSQATLSGSSGNITVANVNIQDINTIGVATFTAVNSIDLGNNFGWNIQNGRDLYWVGGSGFWHESSHWSLTSGGSVGECFPIRYDNVFIDANSFAPMSKSISVTTSPMILNNLNAFNNDDVLSTIINGSGLPSEIYGSLTLKNNISISGLIKMKSSSPKTIASNGFTFTGSLFFDNSFGSWSLIDSMRSISNIFVDYGVFNTQNNNVRASYFSVSNSSIANVGTSQFYLSTALVQSSTAFFNSTGVKIYMSSNSSSVSLYNTSVDTIVFLQSGSLNGNNNSFKYVKFDGPLLTSNINGIGNNCKKMDCLGNANIYNFTLDTLHLSPGKTYQFYAATIIDSLRSESSCALGQSSISGVGLGPLNNIISAKNIKINTAILKNLKAGGVGIFTAINSVNLGGNTNWIFTPVTERDLYWVGGAGDWNDTSHWSESSGGSGGACLPSAKDDVFFDDNSVPGSSASITLNMEGFCKDFTFLNGIGKNIVFNLAASLFVKGNFSGSAFTTLNNSFLKFSKNGGIISYTSGGINITASISFDSTSVVNIIDSIRVNGYLNFYKGTLNSNKKKITVGGLNMTNIGTVVNIDSSYIRILSVNNVVNIADGVILSSAGTRFHFLGPNANFYGGSGRSFHNIVFEQNGTLNVNDCDLKNIEFGLSNNSQSSTIITGNSINDVGINTDSRIGRMVIRTSALIYGYGTTFDTLEFSPSKSYQISNFGTEPDTIRRWVANSTCALGLINISSLSAGSQAKIYINQPTILSNTSIKDINILIPGIVTASNSTDLGNNSNIVFSNVSRNLFWVGGTGNWDQAIHWSAMSGGSGGECIPTLIDNVYFDQNSFTAANQIVGLVNPITYCKNMDWTSVTNSPSLNHVSSSTSLDIYGSLILHQNLIFNYNIRINFRAANNVTIITKNKNILCDMYFYGPGIYTINDTLKTNRPIELVSGSTVVVAPGSMNVARINVNAGATFNMNNAVVQTNTNFILATSSMILSINSLLHFTGGFSYNFSGNSHIFNNVQVQSTANPITSPGAGLNINCNACIFNKINYISAGGNFNTTITVDTLILTPARSYNFGSAQTIYILEYFSASGNCNTTITYTELLGPSSGTKATINTPLNINLSLVKMSGLQGVGSSAPFDVNMYINAGNNAGWNFITPTSRNLFWVGGTGNWFESVHWSLSSGGPGGECPPNQEDNVIFNQNSFTANSQTVTAYTNPYMKSLDWSEAGVKVPNWSTVKAFISGNVSMAQGVNSSVEMELIGSNGNSILCNGYQINILHVNGTGTWQCSDLFKCSNLFHYNGTFNSNNYELNINAYYANVNTGNPVLNLGSSSINCFTIEISSSSIMVNAGTSVFRFSNGGNFRGGNNLTYYNVEFNSTSSQSTINSTGNTFNKITFRANGTINGNHTIGTLELSGGKTYTFQASAIITIVNTLKAGGSCTTPVIINGGGSGMSTTKMNKVAGTLNIQNATLTNLHAIGGAVFNAYNSTGNNTTGWNIVLGITPLFWVGDEGSWSDQLHWSYYSGGQGGACIPSANNDVYFDAASFTGNNKTVDINADAFCKSMIWTSGKYPVLSGNSTKDLKVYGSLEWDSLMPHTFMGDIILESTNMPKMITSKGTKMSSPITFNGAVDSWTLVDSLHIDNNIYHTAGSVNTNDKKVFAIKYFSNSASDRILTLGSSLIQIDGEGDVWNISGINFTLLCGTSTIHFSGNNVNFNPINNFTYYNIVGNKPLSGSRLSIVNSNNVTFHSLRFNQDGVINGNHHMVELHVLGNNSIILQSSTTQTIIEVVELISGPQDSITIKSSISGMKAYLDLPMASSCFTELIIMDSEIVNGVAPIAVKSRNAGNNTNWDITNPVFYIDNDGDGLGNSEIRDTFCSQMQGYVANGMDCNDENDEIYPAAIEVANGINDNCDGKIDENITYTFLGYHNNMWIVAGNWDSGIVPPNVCNCHIIIAADCITTGSVALVLMTGGSLTVNANVMLTKTSQ